MASTIKVDNVQNQPGTNIISKCSTTITIGASSDTVALACGASQTGFGRTGTVDWITTPKVTGDSPVTGVTGKGYFMNTTAGEITLNLPAGSAGDIISLMDYAATWDSNKVIVSPNGSEKIGGNNADVNLNTEGQSVTLVYVDGTQGWLNTMDSTSNVRGAFKYVTATGGSPCTGAICGDYKVHTFTGPGTFCVSCAGCACGSNTVDYLVVAGGGGGSGHFGSGAGAGGYRYSEGTYCSPAPAPSAGTALPVSATPYPIAVGGGGAGGPGPPTSEGANGVNSVFSTITSTGGGGGGDDNVGCTAGSGGSGGGGGAVPGTCFGAGNTPPFSPPQGNPGSNGRPSPPNYLGGAGGGAACAGNPVSAPSTCGAVGGDGYQNNIDGTTYYYAGGGGGSGGCAAGGGNGGNGGGGGASNEGSGPAGVGGPGRSNGGNGTQGSAQTGGAGGTNTGGGGGGGGHPEGTGGAGGSGIVIIRYKFQ